MEAVPEQLVCWETQIIFFISGKNLGGQFNTNYGNGGGGGGVGGNTDNKTQMQVGGRILTVSSKAMDSNKPQYGNQYGD